MNSWEVVGRVSTHHKLIPTKVVLRKMGSSATSALYVAARGDLLSGIAQKVGKEASPEPRLFTPVLATGGSKRYLIASRCITDEAQNPIPLACTFRNWRLHLNCTAS